MKRFRVEPTDDALVDLRLAYIWIYDQSPDAADHWYEGLWTAIGSLGKNPLRCPLAPENSFFVDEIRQLIYGRYRILYTLMDESVIVIRVLHGAREYVLPDLDIRDLEM
ncbi:MAG: type II toxin-antitoxin system RelE/ParE family toxin [Pyrinomonadaceae bacterium]